VPRVWDHLIEDLLHCGSMGGCCLQLRRFTVEAKHFIWNGMCVGGVFSGVGGRL
jgi:hypothetical protein